MNLNLIKLAVVFVCIIVLLSIRPNIKGKKRKIPLSGALMVAILLGVILYRISPVRVGLLAWNTVACWDTLSLILVTYLITFLQRMMVQRDQLSQAQYALSGIFNSRRINASIAPILVGLLPSPAVAFIAGDMVMAATDGYLDRDEQTFVTSYFRHISESFLPTYTSILLALSLSGVSTVAFILGMLPMVIVLILLGWAFYLRKVPKDTGLEPSAHKGKEWIRLFKALWPIALTILLILIFDLPVYIAVGVSLILYFIVYRFNLKMVAPYFKSAWEWNIMLNIVIVMFFKNILAETGVINELPSAFSHLPLPTPIIFALIFLAGTIVAGSNGIIAMCVPMAFAAMPDGGMPLLVLVMCFSYAAMQVSPTHLCLTIIAEYFKTSLGPLVKKTLPVIGCFFVIVIAYYYLLAAIL